MKRDITNLRSTEDWIEEAEVSIDFTCFTSKLGAFPIQKKEAFTLRFENQKNSRLHVCGETEITLSMGCDRCLKEVPVKLRLSIDRTFPFQPKEGELEETDCLIGDCFDVDKLVYNEILLNMPMKVLCREDCKGICRTCGVNLNDETCSCNRQEPDPRMAAIQDIFHQFKEV